MISRIFWVLAVFTKKNCNLDFRIPVKQFSIGFHKARFTITSDFPVTISDRLLQRTILMFVQKTYYKTKLFIRWLFSNASKIKFKIVSIFLTE